MFEKNDIVTIDNNKNYCVMDTFDLNEIKYAYLFDIKEPTNVMCAKVENDQLVEITDENEMKTFLDRLKEDL
jgi:hypothetical protein